MKGVLFLPQAAISRPPRPTTRFPEVHPACFRFPFPGRPGRNIDAIHICRCYYPLYRCPPYSLYSLTRTNSKTTNVKDGLLYLLQNHQGHAHPQPLINLHPANTHDLIHRRDPILQALRLPQNLRLPRHQPPRQRPCCTHTTPSYPIPSHPKTRPAR